MEDREHRHPHRPDMTNLQLEKASDGSLPPVDATLSELKLSSVAKNQSGASNHCLQNLVQCFDEVVTDRIFSVAKLANEPR